MFDTALQKFAGESHNFLLNGSGPELNEARQYLNQRGIDVAGICAYQLGFCPHGKLLDDEIRYFGNDNESESDKRDFKKSLTGKIILPIKDEFGKHVGLATRPSKSGQEYTWWNLPIPFYKSRHLFLLHLAKKAMYFQKKVYIVEGYVDAITLHRMGLKNVVAIMGTKLSARQCALIARYCNNVCVGYDVDENKSGQKATIDAIAILHRYGFCENLSVIKNMPVGEDPDSFVRKNGVTEFKMLEHNLSRNEIMSMCRESDMSKNARKR